MEQQENDVAQFFREYDCRAVVYARGDESKSSKSASSVYLSFKLRHQIFHCAISWAWENFCCSELWLVGIGRYFT